MQRTKSTTVTKDAKRTTVSTVKTASTVMPLIGEVVDVYKNQLTVALCAKCKGLRTGSIVFIKHEKKDFSVMRVGRVNHVGKGFTGSRIASVSLIGVWFSSFRPAVPRNGIEAYANVFIESNFYAHVMGAVLKSEEKDAKAILSVLNKNCYPHNSPLKDKVYWMVGDAREMWEQRKELAPRGKVAIL